MFENKLVVADSGWGKSIPEWIKEAIRDERIVSGMINVMDKKEEKVGDAEVLAYLMTLSLRKPLHHNTSQIYFYLGGKVMKKKNIEGLPDFMEEKLKQGLNSDEERELDRLSRDIYKARGGEISHPLFDLLKQLKKSGGS